MKRLAIPLLGAFVLLFAGCGREKPLSEERVQGVAARLRLLGAWQRSDALGATETVEFKIDGKVRYTRVSRQRGDSESVVHYQIVKQEGDTITFDFDNQRGATYKSIRVKVGKDLQFIDGPAFDMQGTYQRK
jgi:hypothetical protein